MIIVEIAAHALTGLDHSISVDLYVTYSMSHTVCDIQYVSYITFRFISATLRVILSLC